VTGAGAHNLQVTATDVAGNSTSSTSLPTIDLTPPTASIALSGTQGTASIYRSPVAVSFSASDNPGGTGVESVRYSLDGGPLMPTASGANILVSGDGAHTVEVQVTDVARNASTPVSRSFTIDTVAPTANLALGGTGNGSIFRGPVTATISDADNASGSGLATLQYTLDGGPATSVASGGTVAVSANGTHTLTAAATDFAGNTSTPIHQTFSIDTLAPTASIALAGTQGVGANYRSSVVATIMASDDATARARLGTGPSRRRRAEPYRQQQYGHDQRRRKPYAGGDRD
jgi:hypothetical protein